MILKVEDYELRVIPITDAEMLYNTMKENADYLSEYLDFITTLTLESEKKAINTWQDMFLKGMGFEGGIYYKDKLIGMCGIRLSRYDDRGEIGYWLIPEFTGKGIMTKMALNVMHMGFKVYGLNKITIMCADTNYKSQGIPKRLGFKFDGILRQHQKLRNEYRDLYVFSIVRSEWELFYGEE
ncbi:GNAT family N-acetyltransferase [Microaceticoccus formicicus]|uniref:GNAT family N-acetyltransferase n=1 Tax=Microaceticoccus formicicus TaxID=3118105 RepID=UPI003CD005A6|nr:GNAT family protein [Peptoniphilaceae bacterium AMB_02]